MNDDIDIAELTRELVEHSGLSIEPDCWSGYIEGVPREETIFGGHRSDSWSAHAPLIAKLLHSVDQPKKCGRCDGAGKFFKSGTQEVSRVCEQCHGKGTLTTLEWIAFTKTNLYKAEKAESDKAHQEWWGGLVNKRKKDRMKARPPE